MASFRSSHRWRCSRSGLALGCLTALHCYTPWPQISRSMPIDWTDRSNSSVAIGKDGYHGMSWNLRRPCAMQAGSWIAPYWCPKAGVGIGLRHSAKILQMLARMFSICDCVSKRTKPPVEFRCLRGDHREHTSIANRSSSCHAPSDSTGTVRRQREAYSQP